MKKRLILAVPATIFFIAELLTLHSYGINWDSPFKMAQGQIYAQMLMGNKLSPTPSNLPIKPGERISRFSANEWEGGVASSEWDEVHFLNHEGAGHPPHINIVAAFANQLFYQKLGLMGEVEAYNLPLILGAAFGVLAVTLFSYRVTKSYLAAFVSGVALGLYPLYFAEAHFNYKDPLQSAFFTVAIFSLYCWIKNNRWYYPYLFISSVIGCFLVKWNIIFLPFIILPWLWSIRKTAEFKKWLNLRSLIGYGLLTIGLGLVLLISFWPYLWQDTLTKLTEMIRFYFLIGTSFERAQPAGFIGPLDTNFYPALQLIFQTPELILLGLLPAFYFLSKEMERTQNVRWLFLLWLLVPIIRLSLPNSSYYGGIRQIMEVLPVMAILAGVGFNFLIQSLKFKVQRWLLKLLSFSLILLILMIPIMRLHPYQNLYYNSTVGGLSGAKDHNLVDWTLDYGSSYKQVIFWLNKNAPTRAKIVFDSGTMFAAFLPWFRQDLSLSAGYFSGFSQQDEFLISRYNPLNPNVFIYQYPRKFLFPRHEIVVDGINIASIYQNSQKYLKVATEETTTAVEAKIINKDKSRYIQIDLGKKVLITKISLDGSSGCLDSDFKSANEVISFLKSSDSNLKAGKLYAINELSKTSSSLDVLFAGEEASTIRIFPQTEGSCFIKNKVIAVSYLL